MEFSGKDRLLLPVHLERDRLGELVAASLGRGEFCDKICHSLRSTEDLIVLEIVSAAPLAHFMHSAANSGASSRLARAPMRKARPIALVPLPNPIFLLRSLCRIYGYASEEVAAPLS